MGGAMLGNPKETKGVWGSYALAELQDSRRFWDVFKEILEDVWKRVWTNMLSNLPPQTYFPKQPASTNSLSQKSNLKHNGPAVIAAGAGNNAY